MTSHRNLQNSFLKTCRSSPKPLADVLDDLKITHEMLDAWMEQSRFRGRVWKMRRSMARLRVLEIERGATHAVCRITRVAFGGQNSFPEHERRAGMDLIRICDAYDKTRGKRRKTVSEDPACLDDSPAHPNLSDADARPILGRMEQRNDPQ